MKTKILIFIGMVIVIIGVLLFIKTKNQKQIVVEPSPTPYIPTVTKAPEETIKFDATKIKVGQMVGTMKVKSITGFKSSTPTSDEYIVTFTGRVTVSGNISYAANDSEFGPMVCMSQLTSESLKKLPEGITETGDFSLSSTPNWKTVV